MTKTQLLQQRINEIIEPDVEKRLTFGCEIYDILEPNPIYTIGEEATYLKSSKKYYIHGTECPFDSFVILGKQPNLEMLLLALSKLEFYIYDFEIENNIAYFRPTLNTDFIDWYLNIPFENQPEETINTICKILNVEI